MAYTCSYAVQIITFSLIQTAWSDYSCVCNYNVEKAVYPEKSEQVSPIGYMYEFDCKTQISSDGNWISIEFEHQVGYLIKDGELLVQVCAGSPPTDDLVTTKIAPVTTTPLVSITTSQLSSTSTSTTLPVATNSNTVLSTKLSTLMTNGTSQTVRSINATVPSTKLSSTTLPPTRPNSTVKQTTHFSSSTIPILSTIPTVTTTQKSKPTVTNSYTKTNIPSTAASTSPSTVSSSFPTKTSTSTTLPTTLSVSTPLTLPSSNTTTVSTSVSTKSTTMKHVQPTQHVELSCKDLLEGVITRDNGTLFAYGKECFELLSIHTTWINAELECKRKGGHLIDITSSNEQRVVYQVVNTYFHNSVWIGLHDMHNEEKFEWTTGTPIVYTNWYPGRKDPTNHWTEDCVAMGMDKYSGQWEDRSCGETRGFICQFGKQNVRLPGLIG